MVFRRLFVGGMIAGSLVAMAGAQRISSPPEKFKPNLNAPAARPTKSSPAAAAAQANRLPGQQFTPSRTAPPAYSPARAAHDVQVGDFYFRRQDYRGALSRYQGALAHQPRLPAALWGCARAEERLGQGAAAVAYLRQYLAAAPHGRHAKDARRQLAKLTAARGR